MRFLPIVGVLLLSACSPSNNLLLGEVQATVGSHKVVVTDCYRANVPAPEKEVSGGVTYRYAPCRDAVVVIRQEELTVNGQPYGHLNPNDGILVDHSVVSIQRSPAAEELNIPYAQDPAAQYLDLYVPASKGFATIVYTYGGGWHTGSGKSSKPIGEMLRSLGYGCALVSHRLSPPSFVPDEAEDVAAAFAWVKSNIEARGGDPKRVILAGHSSGAHLSLLVATDPRYLASHKLSAVDVAAVIGLSTPLDLVPRPDGHGYGDALMTSHGADAFKRDATLMKDLSPVQHVSEVLPRTLLVVGERDFPMLEADAKAFASKAQAKGRSVEVIVAPGKDHMAVARGMTDANDPVLTQVLRFVKSL